MERKKGQRYSNDFRRQAVERMNACGNVVGLAKELDVCKRVVRVMRVDNLLAVRQEWFRPVAHSLRAVRIYLNLASRMTLSGPNQLWAADITYIRLACEFVYLRSSLGRLLSKGCGLGNRPGSQSTASPLRSGARHCQPETTARGCSPSGTGKVWQRRKQRAIGTAAQCHRLGCRGSRPGARSRCGSRRLHSHVRRLANIVPGFGNLRGPGGNRRGQDSHCVHDDRHAKGRVFGSSSDGTNDSRARGSNRAISGRQNGRAVGQLGPVGNPPANRRSSEIGLVPIRPFRHWLRPQSLAASD
jgi:hypothetical protein